jgi:anti-anti-sigma factor
MMTRSAGVARFQPRLSGYAAPTGWVEIVTVAAEPPQASVQLHGDVDLASAAQVTSALTDQLTTGHRFVRLDLSPVTFMDCAGLTALVQAHNRFLSVGGTLVLTGVGHRIARLLRLTRLDEALLVADGPGQARNFTGATGSVPA